MNSILPALLLPWLLMNLIKTNIESINPTSDSGMVSNEDVVPMIIPADTFDGKFIHSSAIFMEGWAELPQVKFWQAIFNLPPSQSIVNNASCRTQLGIIDSKVWQNMSDDEKQQARERLMFDNDFCNDDARIYVTSGKNHFYRFHDAAPHIPTSIEVFKQHGVDPWYAQTILLIESPGNNYARSVNGAVGPFQLMKSNATRAGLVVNSKRDDRSDVKKSAYAAARLINEICLPKARGIVQKHDLKYKETDLWFRLLVLHVYHAGAGNVSGAVDLIQPEKGGIEFIQQLWQTEYRGFKNQSQNYSQIALAALIQKQQIVQAQIASVEKAKE